jgi:hypothetical protein
LRRHPVTREALRELREITGSDEACQAWLSGESFGMGLIRYDRELKRKRKNRTKKI